MADNENIGGVSIAITGDASQLNAAFAAAQSSAATAGQKVASAFSAGAGSVDELASATVAAASAEAGFADAANGASEALSHQVTQIQAVGAAIRTGLGEQSIRAVERFLAMIPGLGAALQVAFPVIGAIALAESISRVIGKSEELKAAEKELADATQKADDAFAHMQETLDHLNVEHVTAVFGAAAGKGAETTVLEQQAQRIRVQMDDLKDSINEVAHAEASSLKNYIPFHSNEASVDKIKAIGQQYKELGAILDEVNGKIAAGKEDQGRAQQTEGGQLAAKQIEAHEQASIRAAQISKQQYDSEIDLAHSAQQHRIARIESEYARVVATGQEEIRFEKEKQDEIAGYALATRDRTIAEIASKAGAESAGKSKPEQALIYAGAQSDTGKAKDEYTLSVGKAALDVQKAQADAALKIDDLNQKVAQTLNGEVAAGWDKVDAAARKTAEDVQRATTEQIVAQQRVAEIQDKAAGDVKALQIKQQQIELEGKYGEQASHSLAQQVAYIKQIADLEAQANAAKLKGLEADLADAQAMDESLRDQVRIASLQAQIAVLKQQGANQQSQTANQIGAAQKNASFGTQLGNTAQQGVGQLSSAIAEGVMKGGKGLGKDIRESLSNIGREMLGDAIKTGVEDMVIAITGNTIATNLNTIWTELLTLVSKIPFLAEGTGSAPGGLAVVGERGPEIVNIPRGSQVIPNHAIKKYADGTPGYKSSTYQSTAFQTGSTELHFHAHGMNNPEKFIDHVMRKLPETLKRRSPQFSPLAH